MSLNKVSDNVKNKIKKKLPVSLPNNPTRLGYSPETLKKYFGSMAILDDEDSILSELNRLVDETNEEIEKINNTTSDLVSLSSEQTITGRKTFSAPVHWNADSLGLTSEPLQFILGIKAFADGGTTHWQTVQEFVDNNIPKLNVQSTGNYRWTNNEYDSKVVITSNTLAYWDGSHTESHNSNLKYGVGGELAFKSDIDNVMQVAEGKTKSYTITVSNNEKFNSTQDDISISFSTEEKIITVDSKEISPSDLHIGDIILIKELDIPDRYVGGILENTINFYKLETTKVDLDVKQDTLVSGENIKTIDGKSLLGNGDITTYNLIYDNAGPTDTVQDVITQIKKYLNIDSNEVYYEYVGHLRYTGYQEYLNGYINLRVTNGGTLIVIRYNDILKQKHCYVEGDYATIANMSINSFLDTYMVPNRATKTSQLENDSGFLTEHQDISGKADKTELENYLPLSGAKAMTGDLPMKGNNIIFDNDNEETIEIGEEDDEYSMSIRMKDSDYYKGRYRASGFSIGNETINATLDISESKFEMSFKDGGQTSMRPDGFSASKEGTNTSYEDGKVTRYLDNYSKYVEIELPNESGTFETKENVSDLFAKNLTKENLSEIIKDATQSLSGLMSSQDKRHLDTLVNLLEENNDNVVNTINEILAIFNQYPEGANLVNALALKADKSEIVDLNSSQNIAGAKSFSRSITRGPKQEGQTGYVDIGSNSTPFDRGYITYLNAPVSMVTFKPQYDNSLDLGASGRRWRNIYLVGNLTDGTNSITIADIAKKSDLPTKVSQLENDSGYIEKLSITYFTERNLAYQLLTMFKNGEIKRDCYYLIDNLFYKISNAYSNNYYVTGLYMNWYKVESDLVNLDNEIVEENINVTTTYLVDQADLTNIVEIAEGKTNTYVINASENPWFNSSDNEIITYDSNSLTTTSGEIISFKKLKLGDIILITDLELPDRYVGVINSSLIRFYKMETSKVKLDGYALKTDIPKKTSQLTNDSGFLTEHQDISGKADKNEVVDLTSDQTISGNKTFETIKIKYPDKDNFFQISPDGNGYNVKFKFANSVLMMLHNGGITNYRDILPDTNNTRNLGSSSASFKNAYIRGYLSDGTNNVSVSDIANKSDITNLISRIEALESAPRSSGTVYNDYY